METKELKNELEKFSQAGHSKWTVEQMVKYLSAWVDEDPDTDQYKVEMLKKMLEHEESTTEEHYGANLKHWYGDTKALTIDAGGLRCLINYYSTHSTAL